MRQIVFDTETTGLQTEEGHRIIEIGCIELVNRKITGKRYHQYINPQRDIDDGALAVHGLSKDFLQSKPFFGGIVNELMEFLKGAELIIHNAPFDIGFMNYELSLLKQQWKPMTDYCHVVDTLVIARQLHIGQRNSLDALCKRYSVDNSQRELHGALLDAHLLAQVYLAMTGGQGSLFDSVQTVESVQQEKNVIKDRIAHPRDLPILFADQNEIAAHEAKLQQMLKKGKCAWLDS